jgi:hypothetical protein
MSDLNVLNSSAGSSKADLLPQLRNLCSSFLVPSLVLSLATVGMPEFYVGLESAISLQKYYDTRPHRGNECFLRQPSIIKNLSFNGLSIATVHSQTAIEVGPILSTSLYSLDRTIRL